VERPARGRRVQRERALADRALAGDAGRVGGRAGHERPDVAPGDTAVRHVAGVVLAMPISPPATTVTPSAAARAASSATGIDRRSDLAGAQRRLHRQVAARRQPDAHARHPVAAPSHARVDEPTSAATARERRHRATSERRCAASAP